MAEEAHENELISGSRYFISDGKRDGKRTRELRHILTHSVDDGGSAEVVSNANGVTIGTSRSGGGYTINLKVRSNQRRREVAWKRLRQSGAYFRFDIQQSKWQRDQYVKCTVSNVKESGGNGDYSLDVTLVAQNRDTIDL